MVGTISVRRAASHDVVAVDALANSARTDIEREPARWLVLKGAPACREEDELPIVLVACTAGEEVVGCAGLDLDVLDGEPTWWIPAVLVDPDQRQEGVARSLLTAALGVAEVLRPELPVIWRVAGENLPMHDLSHQLAGAPIDAIRTGDRTYLTYAHY